MTKSPDRSIRAFLFSVGRTGLIPEIMALGPVERRIEDTD
jgi:hypothetical protein